MSKAGPGTGLFEPKGSRYDEPAEEPCLWLIESWSRMTMAF